MAKQACLRLTLDEPDASAGCIRFNPFAFEEGFSSNGSAWLRPNMVAFKRTLHNRAQPAWQTIRGTLDGLKPTPLRIQERSCQSDKKPPQGVTVQDGIYMPYPAENKLGNIPRNSELSARLNWHFVTQVHWVGLGNARPVQFRQTTQNHETTKTQEAVPRLRGGLRNPRHSASRDDHG